MPERAQPGFGRRLPKTLTVLLPEHTPKLRDKFRKKFDGPMITRAGRGGSFCLTPSSAARSHTQSPLHR